MLKSFNTPVFPRFLPSMVAVAATGIVAFNVLYLQEKIVNSTIEIGIAVCFIAVQILGIRKTAWRVDITREGVAALYFPRRRVEIRWEEIEHLQEEFSVSLLPRSTRPTLILRSRDSTREIGISRYISHCDELVSVIRERLRSSKADHGTTS